MIAKGCNLPRLCSRKRLFRQLLFGVYIVAGQCFAIFGIGDSPARAGRLGIVYFPYPAYAENDARPLPTYDNLWTRERMQRDARRLRDIGVGVVVLAVDPLAAVQDESYLSDCAVFVDQLKAHDIACALMIRQADDEPLSRRRQQLLVDAVIKLGTDDRDNGLVRTGGRLLCILPIDSPAWRVRDPRVSFSQLRQGETPGTAKLSHMVTFRPRVHSASWTPR